MENVLNLIVGMGEVGTSLSKVLKGDVKTWDMDRTNEQPPRGPVDILHVCFGWSQHFIDDVKDYQQTYKPAYTIVYSTVPIGTCKKLGAMHSPIEGRHPDLVSGIREMVRWIGYDSDTAFPVDAYWRYCLREQDRDMGTGEFQVRLVPSTAYTEFLKLRSTSKYGLNLVWANYEKAVADDLGMDFELAKEYDVDYNDLYRRLAKDGFDRRQFQRYVVDPPGKSIGGHCVVPNAELLNAQYPHELLQKIVDMK